MFDFENAISKMPPPPQGLFIHDNFPFAGRCIKKGSRASFVQTEARTVAKRSNEHLDGKQVDPFFMQKKLKE